MSVQLVSKISNLCGPDPPTSQTDGRTDDMRSALCTIVLRAVINIQKSNTLSIRSRAKYNYY